MRVTATTGQRQAERPRQLGEELPQIAIGRIAGADLGERARRLGPAGIDGSREKG